MKNCRERSCSISSEQNGGANKKRRSSSKESSKPEFGSTNSKDPKMVASRIFVGNLPTSLNLKRDDVANIFKKYGKITGLLLMSGYAFVQFDNENSAVNAKQENGKPIKGNIIEVRVANEKRKSQNHNPTELPHGLAFYPQVPIIHSQVPTINPQVFTILPQLSTIHQDVAAKLPPESCGGTSHIYQYPRPLLVSPVDLFGSHQVDNKVPLDCEIILVDEEQRSYGELVKKRLVAVGLVVEIKALPFDCDTLTMVESVGKRGSLFAIIVNCQNELHRSITVNILYDSPQEHRNMPLEDALSLITRKFDKYVIMKKECLTSCNPSTNHSRNPSGKNFTPPSEGVVYLLNLMADGRFLTLRELDVVLEYVNERREEELLMNDSQSMRGGSTLKDIRCSETSDHAISDSGNFLNRSINNHLSQENSQRGFSSVFGNPLVQKALDNLMMKGPNILEAVRSTQSTVTTPVNHHHGGLFPSANNISNHPSLSQIQQIPTTERCYNNDTGNMGWLAYLGN